MSRGFVKEGDIEEAPFIPPRASLPAGVTNYVTLRGLELLNTERQTLEDERSELSLLENGMEKRRQLAVVNGRLDLLNDRLRTARPVNISEQPADEVRFGATVTYKILNGKLKDTERTFTIVGVDEASVKEMRFAFVAPISKIFIGKNVGDVAEFAMGGERQEMKVTDIRYA